MITIKSDGKLDQIVIPTIFPDSTSQIWKLDLERYDACIDDLIIVWNFEQEAELFWVLQLVQLLEKENMYISNLYIPYLPYGRQDKSIKNDLTFAKQTFLSIIRELNIPIYTLDVHSESRYINSYFPKVYIDKAIKELDADVLVFPDKGAYNRYSEMYPEYDCIVLDKVRDQKTGWITSLKLDEEHSDALYPNPNGFRFLIVDDLADGGATFNQASLFLHEKYAYSTVGLYVTHGIFSKGFEKMIDSGISKFYTTQSLIKNVDGYKLEEV